MKRVTLVKVFVNDQEEALKFSTEKLGLEVAEDSLVGRNLCACNPLLLNSPKPSPRFSFYAPSTEPQFTQLRPVQVRELVTLTVAVV
jgi:hypothetical protein